MMVLLLQAIMQLPINHITAEFIALILVILLSLFFSLLPHHMHFSITSSQILSKECTAFLLPHHGCYITYFPACVCVASTAAIYLFLSFSPTSIVMMEDVVSG